MKVLDPGHLYDLQTYSGNPSNHPIGFECHKPLQFMKREGEGYPGNEGHYDGTNCQEVIRCLIDRIKYLDKQIHDDRNITVISYLRRSLFLLESRAAARHKRPVCLCLKDIEYEPTCSVCGHIQCNNSCRGT